MLVVLYFTFRFGVYTGIADVYLCRGLNFYVEIYLN
jgi:hypothetical protein